MAYKYKQIVSTRVSHKCVGIECDTCHCQKPKQENVNYETEKLSKDWIVFTEFKYNTALYHFCSLECFEKALIDGEPQKDREAVEIFSKIEDRDSVITLVKKYIKDILECRYSPAFANGIYYFTKF